MAADDPVGEAAAAGFGEGSGVRWTTADDNYRARAVYDKRAVRTTWITYDMTPVADTTGTSVAE